MLAYACGDVRVATCFFGGVHPLMYAVAVLLTYDETDTHDHLP